MEETKQALALELETAFRRCGIPQERVWADSIRSQPTETIQNSFDWLFADGVLPNDEKSWFYEHYNFGKKKLDAFDDSEIRTFRELISQINAFAKKRNEMLDL